MSLAHEEPFGGHLGEEKTRERIKLSFVWPKMRREIDKFCKSCEKCQLKARSVVMDRVPITPISRTESENIVITEKVRAIKTKRTQIIYEHKCDPCTILERRSKYSYLVTILNKYQDRFTEKTELCTLVEHEIELKPDFRVKEFAAYRIPFAYRPEVERQIQDMLQQGIIKPSTSRMASPLVIVKKKDGSLRLACDYRYINSFTIECQYPMPIVQDVLNKVGQSNVISIFDCRSAYWTCP